MNAVCPVCSAMQAQALMCHSCTSLIERELATVRALMTDLDVSASKQAHIGNSGGNSAPAHERNPVNWTAAEAADHLGNTLTTWARDVAPNAPDPRPVTKPGPALAAVQILFMHIDAIRRHPAARELLEQITDAIKQARHAIDRPQQRTYLGQCLVDDCTAELYARPTARDTTCPDCGATHPVAERRAWLLDRASNTIVTVRDASTFIGEVAGIRITQAAIRGYLHRGRITYRPGITNGMRIGDLLDLVLNDSRPKTA
jgi:hypothetical protein